ncbi:MAG: hypothetical protein NW226_17535 [Microscillaceae bacterium]|nr:hypothetical protein [Microscillaceae bacterium]
MSQQVLKQFNRDVQKYIYPDNSFYKMSINDASGGATATGMEGTPGKVEIPQEGLPVEGGKNPESFPLPIDQNTDDVKEYPVNWLYTKPRRVADWIDMQTNYNRRQLSVQSHANKINDMMAIECLEAWVPTKADFILRTSGSTTRSGLTKKTSAGTGTRKQGKYEDVLKIMELFGEWDVEMEGRHSLWPSVMLADLYGDLKSSGAFVAYTDLQNALIKGGRIGKLLTFEVWTRSFAGVYTNDSTPIPKSLSKFVPAASDNHAALFWQESRVRRYEGTVKFFQTNQSAENQADLISSGCWSGGVKSRKDEAGVAALVQAHG